jgi:NAD(P) transhydrogenase subunit alpha
MAAEQGGNCELCVPGEVVVHNGVKILGFTDLASRMASTASRFFAMNLVHLTGELGKGDTLTIDLNNDVVRPALITHQGEALKPPEVKPPSPTAVPAKPAVPAAVVVAPKAELKPAAPATPVKAAPKSNAANTLIGGAVAVAAIAALGAYAPPDFLQHSTVFVLACFIGWQVVWAVTPALHTPLMSVTNAISGVIIVGGMLQVGSSFDAATVLGAVAVLFAAINIAGGFLVTQRMLRMFRREDPAPSKGGH